MNSNPIGVFDSGIGGITVLPELIKALPQEQFIYFGDTLNAPYGGKDAKTILELTLNAANLLINNGAKAIVIACNTATSAAIDEIRSILNIPVIGMEPALKLAVDTGNLGDIAVMATALTIKEKKFLSLKEKYKNQVRIIDVPCPGLADLIEKGKWQGEEIKTYLEEKFSNTDKSNIANLVIGCTHYIYIKDEIEKFFNYKVKIVDGNEGTARQLKNVLNSCGISRNNGIVEYEFGDRVRFSFSRPNDTVADLCKQWLSVKLDEVKNGSKR